MQALALDARRLIARLLPGGVKLGLVRGSELDDPHGLLEGRGEVHRFIQLKTRADLKRPGVSDLIVATYAAWKDRAKKKRLWREGFSRALAERRFQRSPTLG